MDHKMTPMGALYYSENDTDTFEHWKRETHNTGAIQSFKFNYFHCAPGSIFFRTLDILCWKKFCFGQFGCPLYSYSLVILYWKWTNTVWYARYNDREIYAYMSHPNGHNFKCQWSFLTQLVFHNMQSSQSLFFILLALLMPLTSEVITSGHRDLYWQ